MDNTLLTYSTIDLFDLRQTVAGNLLKKYNYPWEIIPDISAIILSIESSLNPEDYNVIDGNIWIHRSVVVPPSVSLVGPCIIGANTKIRHCSLFRGSTLVGEKCTIGNSVEIKNSILFNGVCLGHFNYIGDSLLGYNVLFGAGAVSSNVRLDKDTIKIFRGKIETNLQKLGAIIGDCVSVGCNSVINPGTVIGKRSIVFPLTSVSGCVEANSLVK